MVDYAGEHEPLIFNPSVPLGGAAELSPLGSEASIPVGLDIVEMVMAVEEHFGIEIPDETAGSLDTPGKLKEFVFAQVAGCPPGCLSQRAFYRLRGAVREVAPNRTAVVPASDWREVVSSLHRRETWRGIENAAGFRLPALVRPGWVSLTMTCAVIAVGVGSYLVQEQADRSAGASLAFVLLLAVAGVYCTRPLATRFPHLYATVGSTAEFAASSQPGKLMREGEGWSRPELSEAIDAIIEEQTGIPRSKFDDRSHFVHDLRID